MNPLRPSLTGKIQVFDLARPYFPGMPQSPNHPAYFRAMPRRHGDLVRDDGGSAANDIIVMGTHVGTHIDALCHVSHYGRLHGGVSAAEAQAGGAFTELGIDSVEPIVTRGVLLDVPAALGVDVCPDAYEITPADLDRTVAAQGVEIEQGDVILVRSGWGRRWPAPSYLGHEAGVPGVGAAGARWLAEYRSAAVGADTIAFERLPPKGGHSLLPAHTILLVEHGIMIIETLDLEPIAAAGAHEFLFVCSPLKLTGATGSPVRPIAVLWHEN